VHAAACSDWGWGLGLGARRAAVPVGLTGQACFYRGTPRHDGAARLHLQAPPTATLWAAQNLLLPAQNIRLLLGARVRG
jgi:hypothetical protein